MKTATLPALNQHQEEGSFKLYRVTLTLGYPFPRKGDDPCDNMEEEVVLYDFLADTDHDAIKTAQESILPISYEHKMSCKSWSLQAVVVSRKPEDEVTRVIHSCESGPSSA